MALLPRCLRADDVLQLKTRAGQPATAARRQAAETVEPQYKPDGMACCPVHKRALSDGAHGLYCSAKAAGGQVADRKGYCGLCFAE